MLERKWLTIIKLQSKIVDLEKRLKVAEKIISKSVRRFKTSTGEENESGTENLKKPVLKLNKAYKGHKDVINSVSIHPTEPVFASGSGDSTIRIYDYELQDQITILKGHTHSVNTISWEKETLVSGSSDMTLKLWKSANKTNEHDFAEFYCAKTLIGHEHSVSFVYNIEETDITVSCSRDKTIRFWDRNTAYCRRTISEYHSEWVRCCDANSNHFLSSGNDKKVFVFELDKLLNFEKSNQIVDCISCFEVHDNYVEAIQVYKKNDLNKVKTICITASRDKTIGVWNYLQGTQLLTFIGHENWVKDIALYEEFDFLISVGEDKTIRIWDLIKKKQININKGAHNHFICSAALHTGYRILVTGSVDRNSKVWKVTNSSSDDLLSQMIQA